VIDEIRWAAAIAFVLVGLFFTFVSTAGVLRLPDVYSRAHTASQADTLGAGFTLAGVALTLGWTSTTFKTVLLLFFIFITNPTAAHAIARAADEEGVEAWTVDDDRTDEQLSDQSREVTDGGQPAGTRDDGSAVDPDGATAGDTDSGKGGGGAAAGRGGER